MNKNRVCVSLDLEKMHRVIAYAAEGLTSGHGINSPVFFDIMDFKRLPSWLNQFLLLVKTAFDFVSRQQTHLTTLVLYHCSYKAEDAISGTQLLKMTVILGCSPPVKK